MPHYGDSAELEFEPDQIKALDISTRVLRNFRDLLRPLLTSEASTGSQHVDVGVREDGELVAAAALSKYVIARDHLLHVVAGAQFDGSEAPLRLGEVHDERLPDVFNDFEAHKAGSIQVINLDDYKSAKGMTAATMWEIADETSIFNRAAVIVAESFRYEAFNFEAFIDDPEAAAIPYMPNNDFVVLQSGGARKLGEFIEFVDTAPDAHIG